MFFLLLPAAFQGISVAKQSGRKSQYSREVDEAVIVWVVDGSDMGVGRFDFSDEVVVSFEVVRRRKES